jgi:hypothetical protein
MIESYRAAAMGWMRVFLSSVKEYQASAPLVNVRIRPTGAKHSNPKPPNNSRWPHRQDVPQETLHPTRTGYVHRRIEKLPPRHRQ